MVAPRPLFQSCTKPKTQRRALTNIKGGQLLVVWLQLWGRRGTLVTRVPNVSLQMESQADNRQFRKKITGPNKHALPTIPLLVDKTSSAPHSTASGPKQFSQPFHWTKQAQLAMALPVEKTSSAFHCQWRTLLS